MNELIAKALNASISNPSDPYEVDLLVDAASVGITKPLSSTNRKMEWTEDVLSATIGTLKGMPINLKFSADGKIDNHSTTVIGRVEDAVYDASRKVAVVKGKLWKHYFPKTIDDLNDMYAAGKAQVSTEFMPTKMERVDDETDRPLEGRFIGLGIVDDGADTKNFIHLLASAKKEEAAKEREEARQHGVPLAGSLEWINEQVVDHLNASVSGTVFDPSSVVATYPSYTIWHDNGTFYQLPYTVDRTSIRFGDTIEVEQDFKPLSASAPESKETPNDEPKEEANKPMAEITDAELQALKASANKTTELETELKELKASVEKKDEELKTASDKIAEFEKKEEDVKLEKLAASRMEEVEKIQKYDDEELKKADLETFKTIDDKAFQLVKRALTASTANRGGVAPDSSIRNPNETTDDEAQAILQSPEYKQLLASVSAKKENE